MLDYESVFSLNFLSYKGVQTGDHHGMRYRMVRGGESGDFHIDVDIWPEPFCFDKTPAEKIIHQEFPFTEEGRIAAIDWMLLQYEEKREIWDNVPSLLNAML